MLPPVISHSGSSPSLSLSLPPFLAQSLFGCAVPVSGRGMDRSRVEEERGLWDRGRDSDVGKEAERGKGLGEGV